MRRLVLGSLLAFACTSDEAPADTDAGRTRTDAGARDDAGVVPPDEDAGPTPDEDAGPTPAEDAGTTPDDAGPPGEDRIPVVVGVGWQGTIVVSIDEGVSWCTVNLMSDDHDDLFRGGWYADGLFVGAHAGRDNRGAIWVSENGWEWEALHRTNEEPELPENPSGQWYGGVAYGNGVWIAAGGCGRLARSTDGREWESLERFTTGCLHIRSLAFGDGIFVAGLVDDNWYQSTDGDEWTRHTEGAGSVVIWDGEDFVPEVDGVRWDRGRGVCLDNRGWADGARIYRSTAADCSGDVQVEDRPPHTVQMFLFGDAPAEDYEPDALPEDLRSCLGL